MSTQNKNAGVKPNTRSASAGSNTQEDMLSLPKPIDEKDFKKLTADGKLDKVAMAINKLSASIDTKIEGLSKQIEDKIDPVWKAIFDSDEGLQPRVNKLNDEVFADDGIKGKVSSLEEAANQYEQRFQQLENENKQLRRELNIFKGLAQKQQDQMALVKDDVVQLTARSMIKNITIAGLKEEKNENCKTVVANFLYNTLNVPIDDDSEIKIAHRIGQINTDAGSDATPRVMVVKCSPTFKTSILEAFKTYKEAEEKQHHFPLQYYVNEQLPDKLAEKKREIRHFIWEQRRQEDGLSKEQKASIRVQNDIVYVNRQPVRHRLPPIKLTELFPLPEKQQEINEIILTKSDDKTVKGSVFQAFAVHANTVDEAHKAQLKVKVANPSASHIIAAYVSGTDYAFDDDGEYGSGLRLARLLQNQEYADVAVIVVRRYGGRHIGAQRFQIINELALQALRRLP